MTPGVRRRTAGIATVDRLGDPQSAHLTAQVDRHHAFPASIEGVAGFVITVTDLIERVADAVMASQPHLLPRLGA